MMIHQPIRRVRLTMMHLPPTNTGTFDDANIGHHNLFPRNKEDNDAPADNDTVLTGMFDDVNNSRPKAMR